MQVALVAILGLLAVTVPPTLVVWLTNRQQQRNRAEDRRDREDVAREAREVARRAEELAGAERLRQAEVALRASEAARLLLEQQTRTMDRTDEVARLTAQQVADSAAHRALETAAQERALADIHDVHVLVNNTHTEALARIDQLVALIVEMGGTVPPKP